MMLDVVLLGFGISLLAIWIISSYRPRFRRGLIDRYKFPSVYNWTLFLIVMVPGWDALTKGSAYTVPVLIVMGILALGEFAIRRETGAWPWEEK